MKMQVTNHLRKNMAIKKVKGFLDREREKPSEKDVKEWASFRVHNE